MQVLGPQLRSSTKAVNVLNHGDISPASFHQKFFFKAQIERNIEPLPKGQEYLARYIILQQALKPQGLTQRLLEQIQKGKTFYREH